MPEDDPALSCRVIARRLDVDEKTPRRWIASGQLRAVHIGRLVRVFQSELLRFLRERESE
jgi:excisionase family DNA binding protein